jgi:hypothetical protein
MNREVFAAERTTDPHGIRAIGLGSSRTVAILSPPNTMRKLTDVVATAVRNLALQDYAVLSLHSLLSLQALSRARGLESGLVCRQTGGLLGLTVVTLLLSRGELLPAQTVRAMVYRVGMFGSMIGSYFVMRPLLSALQPALLDATLIKIDNRLFGATPAVWLDQFVTRSSVEWFAFFYFSYYWLLVVYLAGSVFIDGGRRRYELMLGAAWVVCIGHSGYTFVPGAGPYAWPDLSFSHALVGGPWWGRVLTAVANAGARLDIFPSLHTALSLLIGLHAFRYRREAPMRWIWLPTLFMVGNIIIATVFLRWHYGIDLVAGASLAVASYRFAIHAWQREGSRAATGKQPVWEPILPESMDPHDRRWMVGILCIHTFVLCLLLLGV